MEVDGGEYERLERVRSSVRSQDVPHLVLWDEHLRNHRSFGVSSWPTSCLIDAEGRVRWRGRPAKIFDSALQKQVLVDKKTGERLEEVVEEALASLH